MSPFCAQASLHDLFHILQTAQAQSLPQAEEPSSEPPVRAISSQPINSAATTTGKKQEDPPSAEEAVELGGTIFQKPDPASGDCWDTDGGRRLNSSAGELVSRPLAYTSGDELADNTVKSKCDHEDGSKVAQDEDEGRTGLLDDPNTINSITGVASDGAVIVFVRKEEGGCVGRDATDGKRHILNAAHPKLATETNPNPGTASLLVPSCETTVATGEEHLALQGLYPGTNIPTDTSTGANRQVRECWTRETNEQTYEYDTGQNNAVGEEGVPGLRGGASGGGSDMTAQGTGTQAARSLSQGIGEAGGGPGGGGDGTCVTGEPSLLTGRVAIERRQIRRPCGE